MIQFVPVNRPGLAHIRRSNVLRETSASSASGGAEFPSATRRSDSMDLSASNRREAPAWSRRTNFKHEIFVRFCAPSDISTGLVVLQKPFKNEDYSHCPKASNPTTPTIGVEKPVRP